MITRYLGPDHAGGFDVDRFRAHVLAPDAAQWDAFGGGANLWCRDSMGRPARMDVIFHPEHGFYLLQALEDTLPETTWVSIGDASRFSEWVDVGDGCHASVALFVSPADAWSAIAAFVEHGTLCAGVTWLATATLPPEANW